MVLVYESKHYNVDFRVRLPDGFEDPIKADCIEVIRSYSDLTRAWSRFRLRRNVELFVIEECFEQF